MSLTMNTEVKMTEKEFKELKPGDKVKIVSKKTKSEEKNEEQHS